MNYSSITQSLNVFLGLFYDCLGIKHIPINILDGKNIQIMYSLFRGCTNADNYSSIPSNWK